MAIQPKVFTSPLQKSLPAHVLELLFIVAVNVLAGLQPQVLGTWGSPVLRVTVRMTAGVDLCKREKVARKKKKKYPFNPCNVYILFRT